MQNKIFGGYRYNDYIKIDTKGYTRITEEYDEELLASSELLNEIVMKKQNVKVIDVYMEEEVKVTI